MSLQQRWPLAHQVALARVQPGGPRSDFSGVLRYRSQGTQGHTRREDEAKLLSEGHRNRTTCGRHKQEHGKSQLDVR